MAIKPTVIKNIRAVLNPTSERDLADALERLVDVLREAVVIVKDDVALWHVCIDEPSGKVYEVWDGVVTEKPEYVVEGGVVTLKQGLVVWAGEDDPIEGLIRRRAKPKGRPRADRLAVWLVAILFHEFTGQPPTQGKHFTGFLEVVFQKLLGSDTTPSAARREVCAAWPQVRGKRELRRLLFGNLVPK